MSIDPWALRIQSKAKAPFEYTVIKSNSSIEKSETPSREKSPIPVKEYKSNRSRILFSALFMIIGTIYITNVADPGYCSARYSINKIGYRERCRYCPKNATCNKFEFECDNGFIQKKNICVVPGSEDDQAMSFLIEFEQSIHTLPKQIKINNIALRYPFVDLNLIIQAFELSTDYVCNGDEVFRIVQNNDIITRNPLLIFGFLVFIVTLMVIRQ